MSLSPRHGSRGKIHAFWSWKSYRLIEKFLKSRRTGICQSKRNFSALYCSEIFTGQQWCKVCIISGKLSFFHFLIIWAKRMLQPSSLCYAVPSLKRLHFYEARLSAYEAFCGGVPQNMKHRRCGMKQSLFRLHIFLPKIWAKKWGVSYCFRTSFLPGRVQNSFTRMEIRAELSQSDFLLQNRGKLIITPPCFERIAV